MKEKKAQEITAELIEVFQNHDLNEFESLIIASVFYHTVTSGLMVKFLMDRGSID